MKIKIIIAGLIAGAVLVGCSVKYSFTGASIPAAAQTFSVEYFSNNATLVSTTLSAAFTDALAEKFSRQTRLVQERENGDFAFEGEITNYVTTPVAITGSGIDVGAEMNRLTITVRVRFTNLVEPQNSFDRSFSAFSEYNTTTDFLSVQQTLDEEIVEQLVDDIFNAAASNW